MITPRQTRLVRVPDLHAFRSALVALANVEPRTLNPPLLIVPTRSAARHLERTLSVAVEGRTGGGEGTEEARGRRPTVHCVTRDELYDRLHARLPGAPRRLTALEREAIAHRAARAAASRAAALSFRLRPGVVAEILRFYDHLRRQSQQVSRFEELILESLGADVDLDGTARRLRQQTQFLADALREYERIVRESGACDEHTLRDLLIAHAAPDPVRHVIAAVPDWIADADGLFVADFDLLARIPGLALIDVVCTERVLASGFHERLHRWLPGIDERAWSGPPRKPVVVIPPGASPDEPWWTLRDREEELVSVARRIKADHSNREPVAPDRTAIVFKRPLPYLYIAAETLPAAGIEYQTFDSLPLAVEPSLSAIDLALSVVTANFGRDSLIALLRSPHFVFMHDGREVSRESISALDRTLSGLRYLGDLERLGALADAIDRSTASIQPAAAAYHAARRAAQELAPLAEAHPASEQVTRLLTFWNRCVRPLADDGPLAERESRGRAAIRSALTQLVEVHATHDDPDWTIAELSVAVRRTIEDHTFDYSTRESGVHLADDRAARFGDFDEVTIVGLVQPEWPERPRRNIFYPPALLKSLGWPSEKDRRSAADAHFLDLLESAARRTFVSTFTLDDDALVSRSALLDEIPRARLSTIEQRSAESTGTRRIFMDEALSLDPPLPEMLTADAREWAELRIARSPADRPQFHGAVASGTGNGRVAWPVSALETYLDCPFKFFAQHVLKLEEEPEDEEVMDPRSRGRFVHEVFEKFFAAWQDAGYGAITGNNLDAARELFSAVVDRALQALPEAEAGLERTRLIGSPAAAGLGDAVFRMEAERPIAVLERLLEHRLEGEFLVATANGPRTVRLRGKADRIDLLADGTFRLIDYKLGWPPNRARALQLPIYGVLAQQRLASRGDRGWMFGEAAYLAFKGPRRVVPLFTSPTERDKVLADAQQRLADTLDAIARGEFPPTPDDVFRCETCTFAPVCRKDYVGDV